MVFKRSSVQRSVRICAARFAISRCSSVREKSMSCSSKGGVLESRLHRHTETEQCNKIALHLVGAAAEGEDMDGAHELPDPAIEGRFGRSGTQRRRRPENFLHQTAGLQVELGAEHLDAGG